MACKASGRDLLNVAIKPISKLKIKIATIGRSDQ